MKIKAVYASDPVTHVLIIPMTPEEKTAVVNFLTTVNSHWASPPNGCARIYGIDVDYSNPDFPEMHVVVAENGRGYTGYTA